MGSILSFVPRQAVTGQLSRTNGEPASVIIFPGGRYERSPARDKREDPSSKEGETRAAPLPRR